MKKNNYRRAKLSHIGFLIGVFVIAPLAGHAQVTGIEAFITAGADDATALTKEYFRPLSSGLGAGINSGWQNSAGTNGLYGFDIQIRSAFARIPSGDKSFDVADLNLQRTRAADPDNTVSPTLSGIDQTGPQMVVEDQDGDSLTSFNLPAGTGLNFVPAPEVQVSVGLLKDTDIIVRFVPNVSLGDFGNFNQYGIGAKHDITSSLPGGDTFPIKLSLLAGYNRVNINKDLNVQPQDDPFWEPENEEQKLSVGFNTFNVRLLAGKTLPFLTVYGGLGYEYSEMKVDVTGDYPVPSRGTFGGTTNETVTDPILYSQNGKNGISGMAGLKIKLGQLDVFADYTLARYPVVNAGIGINFR